MTPIQKQNKKTAKKQNKTKSNVYSSRISNTRHVTPIQKLKQKQNEQTNNNNNKKQKQNEEKKKEKKKKKTDDDKQLQQQSP